ncbi:hypothetical protein [Lactobacillus kefiranofaciens]|uniref:Uncharacterized protein n=1 Tax=Lactobacillus kefiranofaciens TaxID=267818 RepID=A0AAX3UCF0_9LACO|nr:hypothetical protein [Lactobacillus kefiranofaciens]AEG41200.1 hypothetical protein WANG_1505 [Lactobacillus kefiranofaciens subsp. kefiranofaciens]KRL28465.1 hypothetical protein FC94_GL000537 [Lactobacillus kefiranofaciens subsp. kefirgranum DSM 10550 = JCM 8572]KRM20556.1 hypothetical protein FC93_GL001456 [Lactobacillus kefiranofaciens subsp. kefiranofaciens DSM 5016 = JCM 6985]MCJ2172432.1 hypothetical protein [Lactobacillus kefiranofaciens]MCP9331383.1 hypothetical protein [Lactobacil
MNQGKIEEVIRNIIAQEVGNNVSQKPVVAGQTSQNDGDISPLLRELRDSVQEKIQTRSSDSEVDSSSLLDDITKDVKNRLG